jgi:D-alanyl-D-alanine carboxypeptidase
MVVESMGSGRMQGRLRAILLLALLCGLGGFAGAARAGYAAIVVDGSTGQVLQQINADQRDYPASLTKMMTLYLTFEGLKSGRLRLDQRMPVSARAAGKAPTRLGLRAGQTISVQDCILGMITKSANDAATVMAEGIGGSESRFTDMMDAQAALLGMTDTHFANASGLPDPGNTSTAHDLVKLAMALYRDFPQYAHFFATQAFVFRGHIVRGHNNLMYRYPGMDGLKTGFTDASGFNLASTAVRDGHRLFAVVLGGRTAALRDNLMARLLDDCFNGEQTPPILVAEAAGLRGRKRTAAHRTPRVASRASTHPSRGRKPPVVVASRRNTDG